MLHLFAGLVPAEDRFSIRLLYLRTSQVVYFKLHWKRQYLKEFAQPLNVVIIAKTHLRTQARAHVVLFSSDLELAYAPLVDSYSLRFHIEYCFRTLQHMLAAGACQVHSEDTYYGHLVLRLMGCLVLFYTSRVICKGRMTMEGLLESAGWRLG